MIKKKNISNLFILFLLTHLVLWTLIPSISNNNLPLDTIEHLAWASNLDWGFNKHPPLVAFILEIFYQIFGNQDWAYYLLSQIFIVTSFYFIWKLSNIFFKSEIYSLISIFLLEGIYFYNFTTPEFNVNICLLPFWSVTIYYCWLSFEDNKLKNWILLGLFAGLGFLSKYLFIYLLIGIAVFFIYHLVNKNKIKIDYKYFLSIAIFFIIIAPHLIWLYENNFVTIMYALNRTGLENNSAINHLINPILFLAKQFDIMIPFFLMLIILLKKMKLNINFKDKKFLFLLAINILPIIFIFLTSLMTGAKIRTMWMTPFYLYFGTFIVYVFKKNINLKKINNFIYIFLFIFLLSPSTYLYVSLSNENKRTDYPGSYIAYLVQDKWNKNFSNEIRIVVGDEWSAGNLSYHLNSRPKWYNQLLKKDLEKINSKDGVIYTGNPKILKKVCPGEFGTINPVGYCMIGAK